MGYANPYGLTGLSISANPVWAYDTEVILAAGNYHEHYFDILSPVYPVGTFKIEADCRVSVPGWALSRIQLYRNLVLYGSDYELTNVYTTYTWVVDESDLKQGDSFYLVAHATNGAGGTCSMRNRRLSLFECVMRMHT